MTRYCCFYDLKEKGIMKRNVPTIVAAILIFCASANAYVINFDEIAPANGNFGFLTEEYAALGIHFVTTDDGSIFGGMSNGDPGNWDLEGTNGPAFLGFNGASYSAIANFDVAMGFVSLDVSRSLGSADGNTFTLDAYSGINLVGSQTVTLGPINTWSTVSITGAGFDSIQMSGAGGGFHPFGVDNLIFTPAIPAPGALLLAGIGAGLVAKLRRSKRI